MKYYTIKIFFKFSFFFYTFFQTYSYPWWLDLYFDNNISFFFLESIVIWYSVPISF